MKIKQLITLALSLGVVFIPELSAQAPVSPEISNSIQRVDSLTQMFFEEIPSGNNFYSPINYSWDINESIFNENMMKLGSSIAFPYNNLVAQQVRYFSHGDQGYLTRLQQRKDLYFPIFEKVLDKNGLPQEIKYLSVIESSLNPNAVSWCGATGLWQFMPATGKMYDIRIDRMIDDRKSIYVSTEKACVYLMESYKLFGDWLLAIASYNCGPNRVARAIKSAGGVKNFWKVRPFLPKETQNYIPKFLAAIYSMNFTPMAQMGLDKSFLLTTVQIDTTLHLNQIATVLNVPLDEITQFNANYLNKIVPVEGNYSINLPYNLAMQLVLKMEEARSTPAYTPNLISLEDAANAAPVSPATFTYVTQKTTIYHKVRKGENLYSIAKRNGVTASQIKKWNHMKSTYLKAGQRIKILKTVRVKKYNS